MQVREFTGSRRRLINDHSDPDSKYQCGGSQHPSHAGPSAFLRFPRSQYLSPKLCRWRESRPRRLHQSLRVQQRQRLWAARRTLGDVTECLPLLLVRKLSIEVPLDLVAIQITLHDQPPCCPGKSLCSPSYSAKLALPCVPWKASTSPYRSAPAVLPQSPHT